MTSPLQFILVIGCTLLATNVAGAQAPSALTPSLAPMLEKVVPGVVSIGVHGKVPAQENPLFSDPFFRRFFGSRGGEFQAVSTLPNGADLDTTFSQFQLDGEIERRYSLWNRTGKIAVTGFLTRAKLGTYQDAIALAQATGAPADIAAVRQYRSRSGLSMNLEQEVIDGLGVFARAGFASGNVEPDSYTDIDRTVAAGLSLTGKRWGRPDDTFGFAAIANAITPIHAQFLDAGGLGFLIGDGQLPHPGLEQIIETFYQFPIGAWKVTFDYQFVVNPAYNRDRGPVSIGGIRLHSEF